LIPMTPVLADAFTWRPVSPELLILLAILFLPLVGLTLKGQKGKETMGHLTVIVLLGAFLMTAVMLIWGTYLDTVIMIAHEAALYEVNAFSQFLKLIFLGAAILIALVSIRYATSFRNPIEYYALLLTATAGMMVVASSRDFITLFIGIETASLSSYVLAGYAKDDRFRIEASTKYFIVGALSSAVFLYGISLLYGVAGTLEFQALGEAIEGGLGTRAMSMVAIVLILVGLGFKISAAPFHMWAPDVYHGSPDPVAGFLASGSKAMGIAAAFKIFVVGLIALHADWAALVAVLAILSMTVGNIIALRQTSMKRMLAYSSIAQAGYLLIAIVVATEYAVAGGLFHLVTNGIMKATAFVGIAAIAAYGLGDRLDDYKGLRLRNPFLAAVLAVMLLSLAGVPPLGGFASKFVLFSSAVYASAEAGKGWLLWLAIAGIINSLISLFYYVRVVRYMYSEPGEPGTETTAFRFNLGTNVALVTGLVLIVLTGIWAEPFISKAVEAAASLMGGVGA
jgi:proton-translocating NADH-quinone oxidoreductase chain N